MYDLINKISITNMSDYDNTIYIIVGLFRGEINTIKLLEC